MEIMKEYHPNQEQYFEEITEFFKEFVKDEKFTNSFYKTTLLFTFSLRSIQTALQMTIEQSEDVEGVKFLKKEKNYYDAIYKSFKDRQEKLMKQ